jgi:hypothetical protein
LSIVLPRNFHSRWDERVVHPAQGGVLGGQHSYEALYIRHQENYFRLLKPIFVLKKENITFALKYRIYINININLQLKTGIPLQPTSKSIERKK